MTLIEKMAALVSKDPLDVVLAQLRVVQFKLEVKYQLIMRNKLIKLVRHWLQILINLDSPLQVVVSMCIMMMPPIQPQQHLKVDHRLGLL